MMNTKGYKRAPEPVIVRVIRSRAIGVKNDTIYKY